MKIQLYRILGLFSLLIVMLSCDKDTCIHGDGAIVTQEITIDDFTSFKLSGSFNVVLTQSESPSVTVKGQQNIINELSKVINNDVWDIKLNEGCYSDYELTRFANEIANNLQRIEHTSEVQVIAGRNRAITVNLNATALAAYQTTLSDVYYALSVSNQLTEVGSVVNAQQQIILQAGDVLRTKTAIEQLVVNVVNGKISSVSNKDQDNIDISIVNIDNSNILAEDQLLNSQNSFNNDYIFNLNTLMLNSGYEIKIGEDQEVVIFISNSYLGFNH